MLHYDRKAPLPRLLSLNPCCNGIYSMRKIKVAENGKELVLILVVMEYTQ